MDSTISTLESPLLVIFGPSVIINAIFHYHRKIQIIFI